MPHKLQFTKLQNSENYLFETPKLSEYVGLSIQSYKKQNNEEL